MIIELHIIQNFAPSNLNRDETGAPKDCEFGGYRRARISSQALKRAVRTTFRQDGYLSDDNLGNRTRLLVAELTGRLAAQGKDRSEAAAAISALLGSAKLPVEKGQTQYLLFLGQQEMDAIADLSLQHWDQLLAASGQEATPNEGAKKPKKGQGAVPHEVSKALLVALNGGKAADLALFGRMLADLPDKNIDAASQVAHAISTNRVSMEFDFYTAVDDLLPQGETGAGMMGTVEFNSACFYRYSNVDLDQLERNLQGDDELARRTLEAFIRASVAAIPTGKQNSMAAHNPPSLVMSVVRDRGTWNLANAFAQPVRPGPDRDLIQRSIQALDTYWGQITAMYGDGGIRGTWVATMDGDLLSNLAQARVGSVDALVQSVLGAASGGQA